MQTQEFLSEEKYQKTNTKVKKVGTIFLIVGIVTLIVGGILLIVGMSNMGGNADDFISNNNEIFNTLNSIDDTEIKVDVREKHDTEIDGFALAPISAFIIFIGAGLTMAGGSIMFTAHRREILAYTTQQVMPVAQEGMEKMAPTIGKVGATITKTIAPAYGEVAKEISKGIKEGINEADNEKK